MRRTIARSGKNGTTQTRAADAYAALAAAAEEDDPYRLFADALPQMVWTTRPDGWTDYCNRRWCDYAGVPRDQSQGWGWEAVVHPDDLPSCADRWRDSLLHGAPFEIEYRLKRADGVYRWHIGRAIPLRAADGRILRWVGTCTDIDDQKRAEAASRASEERFRLLFAGHPEPMWVYDRETLGFLEVNDAAVSRYGYSRDEFLQMRLPDIRPPSDKEKLLEDVRLPRPSLQSSGVWRHQRKNGQVFDAEITSHTLEYAGRPAALVSVRDVTERYRLERRTRETLGALLEMAEAVVSPAEDFGPSVPGAARPPAHIAGGRLADLTRQALGCTHVAIVFMDPETEVQQPVAIAGFSAEDAPRWWRQWDRRPHLRDRLSASHIAQLQADEVLLVDRSQPPFESKTAFDRHMVLMAPLRVRGQFSGVLSLDYGMENHDYSADEIAVIRAVGRLVGLVIERERLLRERAEAHAHAFALQEAGRRMDEFLGIAGHEMRTPLTTVFGMIQLMQRRLARLLEPESPHDQAMTQRLPEVQRMLQRTEAQIARLNRLVDDLLDVSRIHAGRLQIDPERRDLAALVREVVDDQCHIMPERTVYLDIPDAGHAPLLVDAQRIGQVLVNYLSNAFRYSPPNQPVTVGLRVEAASARVWVRDSGPGLAAAVQERIWERFYRVEGVGHRDGSSVGLGLGLHISRTIVELHGGKVGVESAPGAGATFWFTLPLAAARDAE